MRGGERGRAEEGELEEEEGIRARLCMPGHPAPRQTPARAISATWLSFRVAQAVLPAHTAFGRLHFCGAVPGRGAARRQRRQRRRRARRRWAPRRTPKHLRHTRAAARTHGCGATPTRADAARPADEPFVVFGGMGCAAVHCASLRRNFFQSLTRHVCVTNSSRPCLEIVTCGPFHQEWFGARAARVPRATHAAARRCRALPC